MHHHRLLIRLPVFVLLHASSGRSAFLFLSNNRQAYESVVEDVSWHLKNKNLFGSAGDDCHLTIWDLRTNQSQHSVKAHEKEVNYLSFNPYNGWILATVSSDTIVNLFDMRKLIVPLHVSSGHTEEVFQVEWDPNH